MFFETRKRSKFVPAASRVDFMSRLRCVLAGAPASEQSKKQLTKQLMASASRRFLFETIEPRILLSADLAPGVLVVHLDAVIVRCRSQGHIPTRLASLVRFGQDSR